MTALKEMRINEIIKFITWNHHNETAIREYLNRTLTDPDFRPSPEEQWKNEREMMRKTEQALLEQLVDQAKRIKYWQDQYKRSTNQ